MLSQMLLVLSASLGALMVQAQQDDTADRILSNVLIKTVVNDCFVVDDQSTAAKQPVKRKQCGRQRDERWDVIKSGKRNSEDQFLIVDTVTKKCLTFQPEQHFDETVYVAPCDGGIDSSTGALPSQFFSLDMNDKVTRLQSLNDQGGECVFPYYTGFMGVSCGMSSARLYVIGKQDSNPDN